MNTIKEKNNKIDVWMWFKGSLRMCNGLEYMRTAKLCVHLLSFFFLPPSANSLCKTWLLLKTPTAKHFICRTVFSPGSITPNPRHSFCFLLRVIDIHSNYHHSPLETSLFPQFGVVLRHAIPCPKK